MARLDNDALKIANETLREGFSAEAYIVKCLAEDRLQERHYTEPDIDSFAARYSQWQAAKDSKKLEALEKCLSIGMATFSELLAITSGAEHEAVMAACEKVGRMV